MLSFNVDNIPEELKRRDQWICWELVERNGKTTKVPKRADTGGNAKSTDPGTWCGFDAAIAGCGKHGLDGIGFVFAGDREVTGLDLDHVLVDGQVAEEYAWVVGAADTYTEVSPSGDGLHLFFLGSKPESDHCKRTQPDKRVVEMYDHDRFFTVTGNLFVDANGEVHDEVRESPDALARAYQMWLSGNRPKVEKPKLRRDESGVPLSLTDSEVVERMYASEKGVSIRALMNGDTSMHGDDDSGADQALCNHLAFWTGGDAAQMDRIFRTSGLMRDKWDEKRGANTYGERTIARAIADCGDFYKPAEFRRATGSQASQEKNEEAAPSFDPWFVDKQGRLWKSTDGENFRHITFTPPFIKANLRDVDSGMVRALVGMKVYGRGRECVLDRDTLLSNTKIVAAIAPLGANVSTSNARDVVSYLTDCDGAFARERPSYESVARMGWAKQPLGPFMPYDADGSSVRFDPALDTQGKARPFLEPKGTLEGWVAGMADARDGSVAFRAVLAASFASPLIAVVGVQTFTVYLWGKSRSGKTPTLKAAGSVWGDPSEGTDSYYRTFADTPKSIVRSATFLGDVPILLDELQSKGAAGGQKGKQQAVEDLLYGLSLGHERGALNSNRTMMGYGSWRALTIATGEIPIIIDNTQQGAVNRTLEINAEPFDDPRGAQEMHRLVSEQYGTAGRAYIAALKGHDLEFFREEYAKMRDYVCAMAYDNPQAENIALLALADALAEYHVFAPGKVSWDEAIAGAKRFALELAKLTKGADDRDTDRKAIQFVGEWLSKSEGHFKPEGQCLPDRYGIRESEISGRTIWYVFSNEIGSALAQAGYDRDKTFRRMREEKLIRTGAKGLTMQKRMADGSRPHCYCIDGDALYAFLEGPKPHEQQRLDLSCPAEVA